MYATCTCRARNYGSRLHRTHNRSLRQSTGLSPGKRESPLCAAGLNTLPGVAVSGEVCELLGSVLLFCLLGLPIGSLVVPF